MKIKYAIIQIKPDHLKTWHIISSPSTPGEMLFYEGLQSPFNCLQKLNCMRAGIKAWFIF